MRRIFKQFYKSIMFKLSANNSFLIQFYYKKIYHPKPLTIAHFLNQFSKSKDNITALQVGANDGITHDPIHKFIKRDKWQAILLEPLTDVYKQFLNPLYKNDKNVTTLNVALGKNDGIQNIYKIGFSNARWATGLTSFDKSVLQKAFDNGYIAKQAKKEGVNIPKSNNERIVSIEIEVISLSTLLDKYSLKQIDVLQIDTEGYDFEIIKLFNLKETIPLVIIYENSHLSFEDKSACKNHLIKNNYKHIDFDGNSVAIHNSAPIITTYND